MSATAISMVTLWHSNGKHAILVDATEHGSLSHCNRCVASLNDLFYYLRGSILVIDDLLRSLYIELMTSYQLETKPAYWLIAYEPTYLGTLKLMTFTS